MKVQTHSSFTKPIETPHPNKDEWLRIVWKKAEKVVFKLQKRIYKATKAGDKSKNAVQTTYQKQERSFNQR
jgi:hypothetical protein